MGAMSLGEKKQKHHTNKRVPKNINNTVAFSSRATYQMLPNLEQSAKRKVKCSECGRYCELAVSIPIPAFS